MTIREVIKIDEEKCNGCGLCIPGCPEGALQIIGGKLKLVSELLCDGLGACIKECPQGAITIEKREAESYDEEKVMENLVRQGDEVVRAHLQHLQDHGQNQYFKKAIQYLKNNKMEVPMLKNKAEPFHACPGSQVVDFSENDNQTKGDEGREIPSQLRQWPVQLHLISPFAPYFQGKDVILSADCVAYSLGSFHSNHLKGKSLAIACPKLDDGQESYVEKITSLIDDSKINSLTVMIMEVPCCGGLLSIAQKGAAAAKRKIPIKLIVVGLQGNILKEEWVI